MPLRTVDGKSHMVSGPSDLLPLHVWEQKHCMSSSCALGQGLIAIRWPRTILDGIPTLLFFGSVGFIFSSFLGKQQKKVSGLGDNLYE